MLQPTISQLSDKAIGFFIYMLVKERSDYKEKCQKIYDASYCRGLNNKQLKAIVFDKFGTKRTKNLTLRQFAELEIILRSMPVVRQIPTK